MTVPLSYVQIADDVARRIAAGEYQPGQKLPSYRELAEMYSVGLRTAARAYAMLVEQGAVIGSPGRGMFVGDLNVSR